MNLPLVVINGEHYSVYHRNAEFGVKLDLRIHSPIPLSAKLVEFMRKNPEKVRSNDIPNDLL